MWKQDGTKLTGNYGTWQGEEFELWSFKPYQGMLTLIKDGGDVSGTEWQTKFLPNRFARTSVSHTLNVPAEEVTNRHEVWVKASFSPGCELMVIAEDLDEHFAVESIDPMSTVRKRQSIDNYIFEPFSRNEPLGHTMVYGWLPADQLWDFQVEIILFGTD